MTTPERSLVSRLRALLPRGNSLPDAEWRRRHRLLLAVLWVQVLALPVFGLTQDVPVWRCLLWGAVIAAPAVVCTVARNHRAWWVSASMSIGLLTCSAVLVAFWHGQTEAHFHFFVMVVLLTLYEEWLPFLIAAAYVALHHGIVGVLYPDEVYDHESAVLHPWEWAAVHAGFVAAAGAAAVLAWRLNEDVRDERQAALERAVAAERALGVSTYELQRYAGELERSNSELQEFAYVASHDLSEPLHTVTGFLGLLERRYGGELDDRARGYIHRAVDGTARMQQLIDGLLAYSRLTREEPLREPVALDEVVATALALLQGRVDATGAAVAIGQLPVVLGDRAQLTQAVQNLIANALKFARPGEPPSLSIDARRDGDAWELRVADHGIGIPPQERTRVFQMFHRVHGRDRFDGTGLGLAITERIVIRNGGRIAIEETPGGGATFVVALQSAEATRHDPSPVALVEEVA